MNRNKLINFLKEEVQNVLMEDFLNEVKNINIKINEVFTISNDIGLFKSNEKIKVDNIRKSNDGIEIHLSNNKGKKDIFYLDNNDEIDFIREYKRMQKLSNIKEEPENEDDEIEKEPEEPEELEKPNIKPEPIKLEPNKEPDPTKSVEPAKFDVPKDDVPPPAPEQKPEPLFDVISQEEAKQLIKNTKGKIFTVVFTKKDGTKRVMNARLGVKAYLKGGELPYNPEAKGLIPVFDMQKREYRMVNTKTITGLKIGNEMYKVQ